MRSALVIHSDERQLRFACDALVMFNPGYRVSTARDLETASDWLEMLTPDLVVLEASIADPDVLCGWAKQHSLDTDRTILFGSASPLVSDLGSVTATDPVKLPDFMATVRTIADHTKTYDPVKTDTTQPGGL
jgi:DNA-binding response OmpR family regulator